jgi:hypothetical protein
LLPRLVVRAPMVAAQAGGRLLCINCPKPSLATPIPVLLRQEIRVVLEKQVSYHNMESYLEHLSTGATLTNTTDNAYDIWSWMRWETPYC